MVEKSSGVVTVGLSKRNWDDLQSGLYVLEKWIVGWFRETLSYLHLFLNKL